jgi:predicted TIM-barrel fold metal-dependent hydrolase
VALDCHAHWIPDELAERLRRRSRAPRIESAAQGETFVTWLGRRPLAPLLGPEGRLELMDRHGVALQLLSLAPLFGLDCLAPEESYPLVRAFNDATAELCRAYPRRFAGLAALPLRDIALSVEELRRAHALGLRGAALPADGFVSLAAAAPYRPILDAGDALGSHFFVHPGPVAAAREHDVRAAQSDSAWQRRIVLLTQATLSECVLTLGSGLLDAYRDLTVQIANLGGTIPFLLERMLSVQLDQEDEAAGNTLSRLRSLYVDTASFGPRAVALALQCFGEDRVLLGTDCPIFSTPRMLHAVDSLPERARTAVLEANAQRLFALPSR